MGIRIMTPRVKPRLTVKVSNRFALLASPFTKLPSAFDVTYVAENHENLHHILVFFQITGGTPPLDVLAEVMPLFLNLPTDGGDHLLIKSGPHSSLPLMLPAHTKSGKQEVRVLRDHYELKLSTTRPPLASDATHTAVESISTSLLDSTQLSTLKPTSFVCSSCSLPLIYSSKVNSYRDLPSEHWEELVEAWMCHGDQKLTDQVAKGKRGFWPSAGQALVGGSYILFEEGGMNAANLLVASEKKVCVISFIFLSSWFRYFGYWWTNKKAGVGKISPPTGVLPLWERSSGILRLLRSRLVAGFAVVVI